MKKKHSLIKLALGTLTLAGFSVYILALSWGNFMHILGYHIITD